MSQLKQASNDFYKFIDQGYDEYGAYMKVKEIHGEETADKVFTEVREFERSHRRPEARILGGMR